MATTSEPSSDPDKPSPENTASRAPAPNPNHSKFSADGGTIKHVDVAPGSSTEMDAKNQGLIEGIGIGKAPPEPKSKVIKTIKWLTAIVVALGALVAAVMKAIEKFSTP